MILKLFSEHLSADGKVAKVPNWTLSRKLSPCIFLTFAPLPRQSVDYKGMSKNPDFERYCELAIQLQRVELLSLSREEKLAFFINIYNALVIHGYLRMGAPTNMWQRYRVSRAAAAVIPAPRARNRLTKAFGAPPPGTVKTS